MSGLFKSRPQTTTQSQNYTNTSVQGGDLTRGQKTIFDALGESLLPYIQQGPTVSQAEKNAGRTAINEETDATRNRLESALTARGFGNSGKLGAGFKGLDLERNRRFGTLDATLQQQANDRYQNMLSQALAYTRPFNFTSTNTGSSTGTGTQPGPSYFDRIFNYALGGALGASALGFSPFSLGGGNPFAGAAASGSTSY